MGRAPPAQGVDSDGRSSVDHDPGKLPTPVFRCRANIDLTEAASGHLSAEHAIEARAGQAEAEPILIAHVGEAEHGQEGFHFRRAQIRPGRQSSLHSQSRPVGVKRFLRALRLGGRAEFRHHLQSPQQPLGFITNRLSPDARIAGKRILVNGVY